MIKDAKISADGQYRYFLSRTWGQGERVAFIMLNPSTADANINDPTIKKCIKYAQSWGFGGLTVLNLYAYRTSDPKDLKTVFDPIGPENDHWISAVGAASSRIVAAWGANAEQSRINNVLRLLPAGQPIYALDLTKDGHPKHPLYLSGDLKPSRWR